MRRTHVRIATALGAILALSSCLLREPTGPDGRAEQAILLVRADVSGTLVATVVVQLTAPDIPTPLMFNIPVANGIAAGTITVPAGSNRTITLRAYDAGGVQTHSGAVTVTIQPGTNPTISVVLTPLTGDLLITVTLGSFSVTVQPAAATLAPGDTVSLRAIVVDPIGDPVSGQVAWATLAPGVATVTSTGPQTGRVTAVGGGQTTVVATYGGVAGAAAITVALPTLVQHVSTPSTWVHYTTGLNIYLPNKSLAHNCILVAVQNATRPGVTVSVSDDQANTYVPGPVVTNASGEPTLSFFYALNARAGVQHITVSFAGGSVNYVAAVASEWYNIALSNAFDGGSQSGNASATSTWAAGTFTTGASGDLVYQVAVDRGGFEPYASFTAGSGFTLASADLLEGMVAQYVVQRRAGAVSPTLTVNGSGGYASAAIALKAAAAGTPPGSGIRIVHTYVGNTGRLGTTTTVSLQFPSSGNLLVLATSLGDVPLNSVADGNGNSYTQVSGSPLANGQGGSVQMYYAAHATTSSSMTMTLRFPSASTFGSSLVVYDVAGAAASPFDASNAATGIQVSGGDVPTVSLTPAGPGELVIAHGDQNTATITGLVGSGYLFDYPTWVGQDEGSQEEGGPGGAGYDSTLDSQAGHYYTTDAGQVTFVWTETRALYEWETIAAAFKGASAP